MHFTDHGERLYSTAEAAAVVGVAPATIRAWRRRPVHGESGRVVLEPQGLDERGWPLHTAQAVRNAEKAVRQSGLSRGGFDPRVLRQSARNAETAPPAERRWGGLLAP